MKAFAVLEHDERTGAILFANHAIEARRRGASEYADGEITGVECRRAPWADQFAESGIVPARVAIANGWHFECSYCGAQIDEDYLDEEELPIEGVIGTQHGPVFCSEICEARRNLRKAIRRDHERRMIEKLTDIVRKRFPGVTISKEGNWAPHANASDHNGSWVVRSACVAFDFPGRKYALATLRLDSPSATSYGPQKPYYSCSAEDRAAFEVFASATRAVPA